MKLAQKNFIYIFVLVISTLTFFHQEVFNFAHAEVTNKNIASRRAQLKGELEKLEAEIRAQSKLLVGKRKERVSIERDVAILNAEIKKAQLSIRAREIEVQRLNGQIDTRIGTINSLDEKLIREKESLAQLIRKAHQIDGFSLVEVILSSQRLSDFFEDLDTFTVIKGELKKSFGEIALTKDDTQVEKLSLEGKRSAEISLRNLQKLEKGKIEKAEKERRRILRITKGQESTYQGIIASKEKTVAEIRAELFTLRDSADISFGQAYDYALAASRGTGVRPAFLLGILKNESDLGRNIGQCLLTNSPNKGNGVGKNTGTSFAKVMKASRDVDPFMVIVAELGIRPSSQPVSCPQSIGYGGAMGPAQFIPSTWMLYKKRISAVTGQNPPNPWDPRTAFFASALLLKDNGADKGTRYSERLAALRYFAGWSNAENPAFAAYGDRVMGYAEEFQQQIDILETN